MLSGVSQYAYLNDSQIQGRIATYPGDFASPYFLSGFLCPIAS